MWGYVSVLQQSLNKGLLKAQIQVHLVNMLYYFMPNNLYYASNEMVK
jgi:hypothetical protein